MQVKNKRQILTTLLSVLLSVFLVAGVVMATTTIGLDIANDSTTTTGIALTGTYTTGIKMGTSLAPLTASLTAKAVDIYTTSAVTSGVAVRSMTINQVQSIATGGIIEAFRVNVESEFDTGSWTNAIVGRIDYGDAGNAGGGIAAAISAEIMFPNVSMTSMGGEYNALALEMGTGASTVFHENANYPYSFLKFSTWGSTEMDDHGYLFYAQGMAVGATKLVSANSQTLKVRLEPTTGNGIDRYLVMSQAEDSLKLSGMTTGVPGIHIDATIPTNSLTALETGSALIVRGTLDGASSTSQRGIAGRFVTKIDEPVDDVINSGLTSWLYVHDNSVTMAGGANLYSLWVGMEEDDEPGEDATIEADLSGGIAAAISIYTEFSSTSAPEVYPLHFNCGQGHGADAFFYAVDKDAIAFDATGGTYTSADGFLPVVIENVTYQIPLYLAAD